MFSRRTAGRALTAISMMCTVLAVTAEPAYAVGDLSVADASVVEGTGGTTTLNFVVSVSSINPLPVTADYTTFDATAVAGSDYTGTFGQVSIPAGETTANIPITITTDALEELDEDFGVNLSSPSIGTTITDSQAYGTINNDDSSVSVADAAVAEGTGGSTMLDFVVSVSPANAPPVTVNYATSSGSATEPGDYTTTSDVLTIPASTTSAVIHVPIITDAFAEPNETFTLTLSNPSAGTTISDESATGTITNDDGLPPALSVNDPTTTETDAPGSSVNFTVSLAAPAPQTITVNYATSPGTAASGTDFGAVSDTATILLGAVSTDVEVAIVGDTLDEADEAFTLTLSSPTNAAIADGTGSATIIDNDDSPSLSIDDVTQPDGNPPPSTDTTFTFTVALSAASERTVTVEYATADSTAIAGATDDYDATSGTLTFTPGQTSKPITVNANRDLHAEPAEEFLVNLSAPTNAVLSDDATGVGTINNDDGPPASLSIADVVVGEGAGTATLTVTLSSTATQDVLVDVTTSNGSATAPADYTAKTTTVTIATGQTSATTDITIIDDLIDEPNQTFTATLSTARNADVADGSSTVTITDNDAAPALSVANATATEGATATFAVSLSAQSSETITVQASTSNGTAMAGDDYTAVVDATVTFAPGDTAESVTVQVTGDTAPEANETFVVTLTAPVGATIADGSGAGAITDDDAAGTYTPVNPARILDTRRGLGRAGTSKVGAGQTITLDVTGPGGVPTTGVAAVVVNVTVANPEGAGHVSATPTGGSSTSNVNFANGEVVANLVIVPVGPTGNIRLYTSRTTHLVADVFGWFATDAAPAPGSHFTSLTPSRLLDTRTGKGVAGGSTAKLSAGTTRLLDVTGVGGVPATGVTAVILNVTVTQPTTASFLSVTPAGGTSTSNINFAAGETAAGLVVVPVGTNGSIRYAVGAGSTHVVADVFGWFATPGTLTGSVLTTVQPARLVDTRQEPSGPLGPQEEGFLLIEGEGGVPEDGVAAAVLNLTVTQPTASSYLAVTPDGERGTSNLNFVQNQTVANLAVVPVNQDFGDVVIYNNAGNVHVIVDVFAWFSTPAP